MDSDDEYELDASEALKTAPLEIDKASSIGDVLERFGHSRDERLARTETALIYNSIKRDLTSRIHEIAETRAYDDAREAFNKLTLLKTEFRNKVISEIQQERDEQVFKFRKSSKEFLDNLKNKHLAQIQEMDECVEHAFEVQAREHAIEWENLEAKLSRIPRKTPKYSKTVIELVKMEAHLIKLSQFEDAKVVRSKINRRVPREEFKYNHEFDNRLEGERERLREKQAVDRARLEEKLKTMRWDALRRREKEAQVAQQRLAVHNQNMQHSHLFESRLDPELSMVHPSALMVKRQGYKNTSASLRGQQLEAYMRHEKGKLDPREKSMTVVFADSLVDRHDFSGTLPDTLQLRR